MENATKALLIAAAVLIVIVLIALGVVLLNSGSDVTGQAKSVSESTSIQAFNAQFTGYLGERQTASSVRALHTAIEASNKANADQVNRQIKNQNGVVVDLHYHEERVIDGHFYTVTARYNKDGKIFLITVEDKSIIVQDDKHPHVYIWQD